MQYPVIPIPRVWNTYEKTNRRYFHNHFEILKRTFKAFRSYAGLEGLYAGEVGLYAGEVGEYAGLVGLYAGEVGLYAGEVGE
eukprot:snap_masked-scaffold_11-processed-gene-12.67-mRNA-1 protein AED:1.00 eAED:1.00 QI:0/0/0/0/1/1/2/0/81